MWGGGCPERAVRGRGRAVAKGKRGAQGCRVEWRGEGLTGLGRGGMGRGEGGW